MYLRAKGRRFKKKWHSEWPLEISLDFETLKSTRCPRSAMVRTSNFQVTMETRVLWQTAMLTSSTEIVVSGCNQKVKQQNCKSQLNLQSENRKTVKRRPQPCPN